MESDLERGSVSQPSLPRPARQEPLWRKRRRRFGARTRATTPPPSSTSCAAATSRGLDTGGHVYLDYTGAGLYADSQLERAPRAASRERVRQPALAQPDLVGDDRAGRAGPRSRASVLRRLARRVRRDLHPERDRCAAPGRRGLPVPLRRPLPAHASTTTTRSTGSASSRAPAAPRRPTCRARRPICASTRSCCRAT